MSKEKLGQEPAFPELSNEYDGQGNVLHFQMSGISKRFYAACAAMHGILSSMPHSKIDTEFWLETMIMAHGEVRVKEGIVKEAYLIADELLKQENE